MSTLFALVVAIEATVYAWRARRREETSRVDHFSDVLLSVHMTQHEIIVLVAPPLTVLGPPSSR